MVATQETTAQTGTTVRFIVLTKTGSGQYSEIDPLKTVFSAGDTVRIRIEPRESGLVNIQGATPQPIVQAVTKGRSFETGDILIGAQDVRLTINLTTGLPTVRMLANSMRTSETVEAKPGQPVEIILRVKKP
jgi:hypothetical protein